MPVERQSKDNADFGKSAGVGAYNNTSQPQTEQSQSEQELKRYDRPSVQGDALANSFGLGAFNKK